MTPTCLPCILLLVMWMLATEKKAYQREMSNDVLICLMLLRKQANLDAYKTDSHAGNTNQ